MPFRVVEARGRRRRGGSTPRARRACRASPTGSGAPARGAPGRPAPARGASSSSARSRPARWSMAARQRPQRAAKWSPDFGISVAELERARVEAGDLGRPRPDRHHQHRPEREEQRQLLVAALGGVGQADHQLDALAQVSDRLAVLRALAGALAGGEPAGDGPLGVACLGPVVRDQLGRVARLLRELLLQRLRDLRVQLVPPAAQQRLVGDLLHQRVLEGDRPRRRSRSWACTRPASSSAAIRRAAAPRGSGAIAVEQRVAELPPDGAGQLRHELGRPELIEPRHQRVLQRRRDGQRGQGRVRGGRIALVAQQPEAENARASAPR